VSLCYGQSERVRDLSTIASLQEELSDAHVAMARLSEQEKVLKDALRDTEDRYRRDRRRDTHRHTEKAHAQHTKHTQTEQFLHIQPLQSPAPPLP
jgi:predicted  nucleic acid-binding Zn-ribbon protein